MKERPILFSGPMVTAILEGRKTQTRRVVKFHKPFTESRFWDVILPDGFGGWIAWDKDSPGLAEFQKKVYPKGGGFKCPYGQPGDRLWVRETWRPFSEKAVRIEYKADREVRDFDARPDFAFYGCGQAWHPSIHMPRWASRITLEIVSVRPERLQEITPRDAYAEGAIPSHDPIPVGLTWDETVGSVVVPAFQRLWDSINGKTYPWASNPWVWRIGFRRLP